MNLQGPQPSVDLAVEDADHNVGFVRVPSVARNLRNLARAVTSRRYPVLLQVWPEYLLTSQVCLHVTSVRAVGARALRLVARRPWWSTWRHSPEIAAFVSTTTSIQIFRCDCWVRRRGDAACC